MSNDYNKMMSFDNLARSWRWIQSNPDFLYKKFFREAYTTYALSETSNLKDLGRRLKEKSYSPHKPCQVFMPKNQMLMRPFTLLSIEDQIVYQAIVNIIAEKHKDRNISDYNIYTFSNMYAGTTSPFFFYKWDRGYKSFLKALESSYMQGLEYMAQLDIVACYDSIDHAILRQILIKYGMEIELIDFLIHCLKTWTAKDDWEKNSGIPQGPLSSGLLSEVILSQLDRIFKRLAKTEIVRYVRYVDDVKIMSKSEESLKMLVSRFDFRCKELGLFPNSAKIKIEKTSIETIKNSSFSHIEHELINKKVHRIAGRSLVKHFLILSKEKDLKKKTELKLCLQQVGSVKEFVLLPCKLKPAI